MTKQEILDLMDEYAKSYGDGDAELGWQVICDNGAISGIENFVDFLSTSGYKIKRTEFTNE